eukprot:Skav221075  [mRNA]  locus=scaffold3118:339193:341077:- [translate_table: standard]
MTKNVSPASPKSEEEQLAEAIKLSLEQAPEADEKAARQMESAFDFKRRECPEKKRQDEAPG